MVDEAPSNDLCLDICKMKTYLGEIKVVFDNVGIELLAYPLLCSLVVLHGTSLTHFLSELSSPTISSLIIIHF